MILGLQIVCFFFYRIFLLPGEGLSPRYCYRPSSARDSNAPETKNCGSPQQERSPVYTSDMEIEPSSSLAFTSCTEERDGMGSKKDSVKY